MNFIFKKIPVSTPTNNLKSIPLSSLRIFPALILSILFLGSCTQSTEKKQPHDQNKPVRYLALGDSYTIGESVPEPERWPNQLADSLRVAGLFVEEVSIIARTGWTTAELQQGIEEEEPLSEYDLVSLLIGVNNQYRGYDLNIYRKEFKELLQQAIGFARGNKEKVFVVSIPNYGVTPFGQSRGEERIRQELLIYDAIADSIASTFDIPFVNISPISEWAKDDPSLIAEDELHPSGEMYSLWVKEMIPTVREILSEQ
ncbi:MAG: SGNH/GDSL hydrolase family protein [Balneola sp.]|nr:MAG: SGNH/GDSL hydrolase family protein [Balneola sp.]